MRAATLVIDMMSFIITTLLEACTLLISAAITAVEIVVRVALLAVLVVPTIVVIGTTLGPVITSIISIIMIQMIVTAIGFIKFPYTLIDNVKEEFLLEKEEYMAGFLGLQIDMSSSISTKRAPHKAPCISFVQFIQWWATELMLTPFMAQ